MQGRFFQVQDSSHWHKIINVNVSTSTVILDTPVTDVNGSGKTFKIWKRFYYMPSEVVSVLHFGRWDGSGRIDYKGSQIIQREVSSISTEGSPVYYSDYGVDPYESTYAAGTVSISANDNVVTGVGTEALVNIDSGDIFTVNSIDYRVKRVETDTRWVLYNYNGETAVDAAPYTVKKDNPLGFQFYYSADDYKIIPYEYLGRAFDMVNETYDSTGLPEDFDKAILSRAESLFLKDKDDPKWTSVLALYAAEVDGKKISSDPVSPSFYQFSPGIPHGIR